MKSRMKGLVAVSFAAALLGATAVPATAAPAGCPSGYACAWKDRDYKTAGSSSKNVRFEFGILNFASFSGWDNQITSIYNNGNLKATYWYVDKGYNGSRLKLGLKAGKKRLNETNPTFNDTISSARFE